MFRKLQWTRSDDVIERGRSRFTESAASLSESFTSVADRELRRSIISEWQQRMKTENVCLYVCAVCGRRAPNEGLLRVDVTTVDLTLLRNDELPDRVLPTTYAFQAYNRALLHPKGMTSLWSLSDILICVECEHDLCGKRRMPKYALANWLYYGYDELPANARHAFDNATRLDRVLISRARASKISFRFSELPGRTGLRGDPMTSQSCIKGNVLIMPQDSTRLSRVLPPSADVIRDTVCAVFVGGTKPTQESIAKLGPVLVRKSRVKTMIEFLVEHNPHYAPAVDFQGLSAENLDMLFGESRRFDDEGVPCSMEIGHLEETAVLNAVNSDYTGREEAGVPGSSEDGFLLENVGYTDGHETPMSYREMKMTALNHCRQGGRFVASQAGNRAVPDFKNSQLLSWLFPHLDPWGIGGFYEPRRSVAITLEDQLSYLLRIDDSRFERDADFAFVYYNIRQKKMVWDSVNFRVRASQKDAIVQRLLSVDKNLLRDVIGRYDRDPLYMPQTVPEQELLRLLNDVGMVARELPGTAGYKRRMRNEIRSLIYFRGTPALFVTLNPSDVHNPLVRILAGDEIDLERAAHGVELTEWQRAVHAANRPAACAMFFHLMISTFIDVILRHGRPERGLFGRCSAYFGTVEAQGRGTLHCHLLIWLDGHPNPQSMRDMMDASPGFRADLIQWLESLIKCELLGTMEEVREVDGIPLDRPRFEDDGMAHPGTLSAPDIEHYDQDAFEAQYELFVNDLVRAFNWHVHCETC